MRGVDRPAGSRGRWLRGLPLALLLVLAVSLLGFVVWASTPSGEPMPQARAALEPGGGVEVATGRWLVFRPAGATPEAGFAFYPGARVPAAAYAPMARKLAAQGFLVVLMPVRLNLAILEPGEAGEVMRAFPEVRHWTVGGHSLGGVAAAGFAHDHPKAVEGLVLMASYPQDSDDLSGREDLIAASIYGTRDGLASPREIRRSAELLPPDTRFVAIRGGNHAYFGWYGPQSGDNRATITRREEQARIVAATARVLRETEGR
jgi:pimeloyl-ACP methyl ester carboxylesterase